MLLPIKHRLVVVGGGIAGIDIATHLARRRVRGGSLMVTLVDRETAHVWKPMLHTIAAGTRDVYQQQTTYAAQARASGFVFRPGEVIGVNREKRTVQLAPWLNSEGRELLSGTELPYDTLVLALGSRSNDFGTPGVAEYCHRIDSRQEAIAFNNEVRIHILQSIQRNSPLSIAIVGGGATGVELAAELIKLAELSEYYGALGMAKKVKVILLERGSQLLVAFPKRVAQAARLRLQKLGVDVRVGTRVAAAEPTGFRLVDGSVVEAGLKIWAAGVKGPDILASINGLEAGRGLRLMIGPRLQTTQDPNIFAVGDCASRTLAGQDVPLPPTAQVAYQQARYLISHLPALLEGHWAPDFQYRDFGSIVSLGGYDAFGSLGKFGFFDDGFIHGRVAQLGIAMLYRRHQARLYGFWRGGLLWLVDLIDAKVRPAIRLD